VRTLAYQLVQLAVLAGAAFGVISSLYLLVSFFVMRSHTPSRSVLLALRAMLVEALAIAVTQPLIPFFYVIGRRLGGARDGRPVIFVHGYFQNRADFVYLAWVARKASLGPLYGFNYNWAQSIVASAAQLASFVEQVCRETGKTKVALVAHSLGGVVSLEYLSTPAGVARVDRCVTIASPHAGVTWRLGMVGAGPRQLRAQRVHAVDLNANAADSRAQHLFDPRQHRSSGKHERARRTRRRRPVNRRHRPSRDAVLERGRRRNRRAAGQLRQTNLPHVPERATRSAS